MIHFKTLLSKYNIMVKCTEIHIQANFHIDLFVGMNWPLNPLTWPWMVDRPFGKMPSGWPPSLPDSEAAVVFIFTSNACIYNMVKQNSFIRYELLLRVKTFHKPLYLSKKVYMSLHHFQHVGCDLIQVLDATDIHCQQWPFTLMQHKKSNENHFVTKSRGNAHFSLKPIIFKFCITYSVIA